MLNLNNIQDRRKVYIKTKKRYEEWLGTPGYLRGSLEYFVGGLCRELGISYDILKGDINTRIYLDKFPELYMFKTYANPDSAYWFPKNDIGHWKRVSILNHSIRMCNYPWTIPFYKLLIRFKLIRLGL